MCVPWLVGIRIVPGIRWLLLLLLLLLVLLQLLLLLLLLFLPPSAAACCRLGGPLGTQPLPRVLERAASAAVVCEVPAYQSRRGFTTSTRHSCSRTSWGCAGCT